MINTVFFVAANGHQIFSLIHGGIKPNFVFDGMTSDRDGNLYVAAWGGSKIVKFQPRYAKLVNAPQKILVRLGLIVGIRFTYFQNSQNRSRN